MSVEEFLKNRNIPENMRRKFMEEKIDVSVIRTMSEDELKMYLPAHGDRVALKAFANRSNRCSLIEKLNKTYNIFKDKKGASKKKKVNEKETRKIEIGWTIYDEQTKRHKQIRGPVGGNRRISMSREAVCADIQKRALELFFPDGESAHGSLNDFDVELLDFKSHKFDENLQIQRMYELTGLTTLRFYLSCRKKKFDKDSDWRPHTIVIHTEIEDCTLDNLDDDMESYTSTRYDLRPSTSTRTFFESFPSDVDLNTSTSSFVPVLSDENLDNNVNIHNFFEITDASELNPVTEKLILHRGNIFHEIIGAVKGRNINFKNIQIEMILPNGSSEVAQDLGGVLRDSFSEFFNTFYEKCTMGTTFKIPCLRHDFQKEEWNAIGNIIFQCFNLEGYFPIKLAPIFVKDCLGEHFEDGEIMGNFFKYVSASESKLLKHALENFDDVEFEEIMEFCTSYDAKTLPSADNLKTMLLQIAKEEMIQKPSFVKECFKPSLYMLKKMINLDQIYIKLEPTDKNILALFHVNENLNSEQTKIYGYLKKFIREPSVNIREAFLRFSTGSDLPIHNIKIDFIDSHGLLRVPIAHTCAQMVEIPLSYENFMTFRSELNTLLSSNIWVIDLI